jgi:hypothetical protein
MLKVGYGSAGTDTATLIRCFPPRWYHHFIESVGCASHRGSSIDHDNHSSAPLHALLWLGSFGQFWHQAPENTVH